MSASSRSSSSRAPVVIVWHDAKIYINDSSHLQDTLTAIAAASTAASSRCSDTRSLVSSDSFAHKSLQSSHGSSVASTSKTYMFDIYDTKRNSSMQTDESQTVDMVREVASCLHDSGTQTDVQSSLTVEASTQSVDTVEYITGLENDLNLLTSKTSQMLIAYEQLVIKYEALYGQKVAIASDAVGGDCVDAQDVDAMADDSSSRISSWADASDNPEESVPVAADTVVTGWKRKNGRKKK
eukprot:TRINITY_DN21854_c0_g2_i5.p1 TRINITY_DN21854_c0_g2~~TRINITY_DN21854_c0_g2_i5.p1  ORF type:complete len:239 (-),score=31.46 TRINITY_DN21854_c0_g2_i5:168-884(-)